MSKNFFGDLQILREKPIPDLSELRQRRGYRTYPIDNNQPLYNEALIDLAALGIEGRNHYSHAENPPYYQKFDGAIEGLYLRETVAQKLQKVDKRLRENGLKLFVYDAYRPTKVQAYAYDVLTPAQLRKKNPTLEGEALIAEVKKYWAPPTTDPNSPAPHKTGGAVDLTLATLETGQPLFMGTIFDDIGALVRTESFESRINSETYSDQEAIGNRRILYWSMLAEGFASNPGEWWHYSFGDQLWAQLTGAPAALYGPAELPEEISLRTMAGLRPGTANTGPKTD